MPKVIIGFIALFVVGLLTGVIKYEDDGTNPTTFGDPDDFNCSCNSHHED